MADTLQDIALTADTWVNIYTHPVMVAAGVTVGTQISVQNKGSNRVFLHAGADMPTETDGSRSLRPDEIFTNETNDTGAWVMSRLVDGIINARAE